MNYIGSKLRLLDFLETSIKSVVGDGDYVFCDLFSGTGIVGSHFKKMGYEIISNDLQYYSYVLNRHLVGNNTLFEFKKLFPIISGLEFTEIENRPKIVCDFLNDLPLIEGFSYKNYSSGGTINNEHIRLYFSDENAKICDTIRTKIEEWKINDLINENEYFFLLSSLIESVDEKANTTSVYGAFLKSFKKSALDKVIVKPIQIITSNKNNIVFNKDSNLLVKEIECDIMYLDPPYNNRVYGDNYHVLETIARYDNPEIVGKTGNRKEKTISKYSRKREVKGAFTELIRNCNCKYIFLSYNNEGLLSLKDIEEIMSQKGEYGIFTKKYQRYKSDKDDARNHKVIETFEYLHYVKCK
jgi:adenine-specific DNA-methyltransferase